MPTEVPLDDGVVLAVFLADIKLAEVPLADGTLTEVRSYCENVGASNVSGTSSPLRNIVVLLFFEW